MRWLRPFGTEMVARRAGNCSSIVLEQAIAVGVGQRASGKEPSDTRIAEARHWPSAIGKDLKS